MPVDEKIADLTALTTPAYNDVIPIVDSSVIATKGITIANLLNFKDVDFYGGLAAAVATWNADGSDVTLLVKSSQDLTENLTVNDNITLIVTHEALIDGSITLTINGPFEHGLSQCFGSSITVVFGNGAVKEVHPEWWGNNTIPGTTDMTTEIQSAITAANGLIRFLSIYAISSTISLKSATAYLGPEGGTFIIGTEHPQAGYGAALKWVGAASSIMVRSLGLSHVYWDGIDLDGVDRTDSITGFRIYSVNAPVSRHLTFRNFNVFNCDVGMNIGAESTPGGTQYQTDDVLIERFQFNICNTGIYCGSQNALDFSNIKSGWIATYDIGIHLHRAGFLRMEDIGFGGLANDPTTGAFIYVGITGALSVGSCQGEAAAYTGWNFMEFLDNGGALPITLSSCVVDKPITVGNGRRVNSQGCQYNTNNVELEGDDIYWTSINDYFTSGTINDTGTNNIFVTLNSYFGDGAQWLQCSYNQIIQTEMQINAATFNKPFANFANADATPSVSKGNLFKTANTGATIITTFHDGLAGQVIKVIFGDANTTIDFTGTNLKGNVGGDWTPADGDWMEGVFDGTDWFCSVHDCTA